MILPSAVLFLGGSGGWSWRGVRIPVGIDDEEVLAGAFRRPRGSLWSDANSKTEPEDYHGQLVLGKFVTDTGNLAWNRTWHLNRLGVFEDAQTPFVTGLAV
jgi:hypothetical protein